MRESQTRKIPYTVIIGDKEVNDNLVSYRLHRSKDTCNLKVEEFVDLLNDNILNHK
jgi:threonyl-tRNA synthetase